MNKRDKSNLFCDHQPKRCSCGAIARIRYRMPVTWVECKRKCGMHTGYYIDGNEYGDPEALKKAVEEWDSIVNKNTK